ncbi:hypothetical protein [Vagococcus sp.]|uniref:hypothetical protein n=1 Tax=Vagococcus sp. TaxID=1933889 RepID=UPI003F946014
MNIRLIRFLADNPFYFEDTGLGVSALIKVISISSLVTMSLLWIIPIINQIN